MDKKTKAKAKIGMSKTAKTLIDDEIRKLRAKLRRLDYDRDKTLEKIEELEDSLKSLLETKKQ